MGNIGQHDPNRSRLVVSPVVKIINRTMINSASGTVLTRGDRKRHHEEMSNAGHRIRLRRTAAGLNRHDLAAASGVDESLIAADEHGSQQPTEAVRRSLGRPLRVRPSQLLRAMREQVVSAVAAAGGTDARVAGSVARGDDEPDSDLDLVVRFPAGADIVTLLTLEEQLSELLTAPVNVISADSSSGGVKRALTQAPPL